MLAPALAVAWLAAAAPNPSEAITSVAAGGGRLFALADMARAAIAVPEGEARYAAAERATSNWRGEAVRTLSPLPVAALAVGAGAERPVVTRCVKLNNYWCIKRAGWTGEIGFDDEGHVGFASAERGADAAVTLLRRYYLEFGRRSALDIVRRWAPPGTCYAAGAPYRGPALAVHGLGNTLRARYLASKGRRVGAPATPRLAAAAPRKPALASPGLAAPPNRVAAARAPAPRPAAQAAPRTRVSAVPLRPLPSFRMPDIAAGMGGQRVVTLSASLAAPAPRRPAPVVAAAPRRATLAAAAPRPNPAAAAPRAASRPAAAAPSTASPAPRPAPPPVQVACGSEESRIRNYAARIVDGLGVGPGDDLQLFEPDGRPKPNLVRVLVSMSGFELGYLRAGTDLVVAAVERQAARARAAAAATAALASPAPSQTP